MEVSVYKYSTVPVQGPQKGLRVISIRNLAKVLKEVDGERGDVNSMFVCFLVSFFIFFFFFFSALNTIVGNKKKTTKKHCSTNFG